MGGRGSGRRPGQRNQGSVPRGVPRQLPAKKVLPPPNVDGQQTAPHVTLGDPIILTPEQHERLISSQNIPTGTGASSENGSAEMPDRPPDDRKPRRSKVDEQIVQGTAALYGIMALAIMPFNQYDATVIGLKATDMAEGWLALGKQYPEVMKWLIRLTTANAVILFAKPHLEVGAAVAANHGMMRPQVAEIVSKIGQPLGQNPPSSPTSPFPPTSPQASTSAPASSTSTSGDSLTPEQLESLRQRAIQAALAEQIRIRGQTEAGYNPTDVALRPEQNPAINLVPRSG